MVQLVPITQTRYFKAEWLCAYAILGLSKSIDKKLVCAWQLGGGVVVSWGYVALGNR